VDHSDLDNPDLDEDDVIDDLHENPKKTLADQTPLDGNATPVNNEPADSELESGGNAPASDLESEAWRFDTARQFIYEEQGLEEGCGDNATGGGNNAAGSHSGSDVIGDQIPPENDNNDDIGEPALENEIDNTDQFTTCKDLSEQLQKLKTVDVEGEGVVDEGEQYPIEGEQYRIQGEHWAEEDERLYALREG
jgi:hypothetical protein